MRPLFIFCLLLFSIPGYSQLVSDSVLIEGHYRSFHFNKPTANIKNASLLFVLHGSGGNGKQMLNRTTKLEGIVARENLIIVYPDGYKKFWNECRKSSNALANIENINENAFFEAMIKYFKELYSIDKNYVFAAGFSGGGHMAYKLGITMPGKIKAIAAIVANLPDSAYSDCIESRVPIPVIIVNGTLDKVNPYHGGEMFVNNSSFGSVRSSENSFYYWARLAGYQGEAVKKLLPNTDTTDQKTIESYTYKEDKKPEIKLLKVIGGGHDYPNDVDVYSFIWDFFKRNKDFRVKK